MHTCINLTLPSWPSMNRNLFILESRISVRISLLIFMPHERIWFFAVKSEKAKKKKNVPLFVFWDNLQHANLLTVLSDL